MRFVYKKVLKIHAIHEFQMKYEGKMELALETRLDLMRLKEHHDSTECAPSKFPSSASMNLRPLSRYSDEEMPESPESSPDEDYGSKLKPHENGK